MAELMGDIAQQMETTSIISTLASGLKILNIILNKKSPFEIIKKLLKYKIYL